MTLIGKRKEKGIWIKEYTLWTKSQIAVLAYFKKHNNKPATYRDIARSYGRANYADYKKACEKLESRGYLEKLEKGENREKVEFKVRKGSWPTIQKGKETVERSLPYFQTFLKKSNDNINCQNKKTK